MSALIAIWVLCGIAGAVVAEKRGRNALGWGVICILTGVLGLFVLVVSPRQDAAAKAVPDPGPVQRWKVPCAHCGEPLLAQAGDSVGCPHCKQRMQVHYDGGVVTAEALSTD
jgi:hypothetical protein